MVILGGDVVLKVNYLKDITISKDPLIFIRVDSSLEINNYLPKSIEFV